MMQKLFDPSWDPSRPNIIDWDHRLRQFYELVMDVHADIRPLTFISTNNAIVDPNRGSMNLWESIPELPEALAGLRSLEQLLIGCRRLASWDPGGARDIVSALSSGYLYSIFGLQPTIDDVATAYAEANRIYAELGELSKQLPKAVHGRAPTFNIPVKWDLDGRFDVQVRTTLHMNHGAHTLITLALLATYSGALPTVARIWGCVPWSFALDWFTSLESRLQDLDGFAIRACLPMLGSTHTFLYRFFPSAECLNKFGLRDCSSGGEEFHFRLMIREVSRYMSGFWPNVRFDFHPPRGIQKLTSAALVLSSV